MNIDTTLLTVGFPDSNDIGFSKSISQKLNESQNFRNR